MRNEVLIACVLAISVSQFSFAQAPAEVFFYNGTGVPLTVRCFSKSLDLAGFSEKVNPEESAGTANLASGDRVIGVWSSDQVISVVRRFRPGSASTVTLIMRDGKLGILPTTVQGAISQQAEPSQSHFHSREWQTNCQASDGKGYPVSVDFTKSTYTTQAYTGQFSNMTIRETKKEWKMSGRWSSPSESGDVTFTVSKANLNYLSGSYTVDGNTTAYEWKSR